VGGQGVVLMNGGGRGGRGLQCGPVMPETSELSTDAWCPGKGP